MREVAAALVGEAEVVLCLGGAAAHLELARGAAQIAGRCESEAEIDAQAPVGGVEARSAAEDGNRLSRLAVHEQRETQVVEVASVTGGQRDRAPVLELRLFRALGEIEQDAERRMRLGEPIVERNRLAQVGFRLGSHSFVAVDNAAQHQHLGVERALPVQIVRVAERGGEVAARDQLARQALPPPEGVLLQLAGRGAAAADTSQQAQ